MIHIGSLVHVAAVAASGRCDLERGEFFLFKPVDSKHFLNGSRLGSRSVPFEGRCSRLSIRFKI